MGNCAEGGSFQVSSCTTLQILFLSHVYYALEFSLQIKI